ncbi:MAG: carbohydrate ABC transporter permease [Marvinbryantia sp.]|jgi:putative aldouronate transport system permease protein
MKKTAKGDRLFLLLNDLILLLVLLIVLYPLIYIVSSSFSSPQAVSAGLVRLLPVEFSLRGYEEVFKYPGVLRSFLNSVFYTVAGTLISMTMTVMAAYPLYYRGFAGKKVLTFLFTFTMIFSGGLIPSYLLNSKLGLLDTAWVLLIPNAISIFNLIIIRSFFEGNIPEELNEAAKLDGCSQIKFLTKVVLPLSKPILAVVSLYYAVEKWNMYFDAFIYLKNEKLYPLQIILRKILVLNQTDAMVVDPTLMAARQGMSDLLKYSLIIVSSLPLILVYPLVQKHFTKGTLTGAVKG